MDKTVEKNNLHTQMSTTNKNCNTTKLVTYKDVIKNW